jgi:hypothetical protein
MSDFDPVLRLHNLATRFANLASHATHHESLRASALHAALKTAEHVASACERDINHRDCEAAAGELQDAQGTAVIAEKEYAR